MTLPPREGPRPKTTSTIPHSQIDQQPVDTTQQEQLAAEVFALPGVLERESQISVPGARALWLGDPTRSPDDAFLIGAEFAHLHPGADQSLHVMLPPSLVDDAISAGWAEQHPFARSGRGPANAVMIYAPRDDAERAVVAQLVKAAHEYASGRRPGS